MEEFLATWSLSAELLARHFPSVELYTDSLGEAVAQKLKLPYREIHPLPHLEGLSPLLWNLPKLITYQQQKTPFVHVDLDFLLWEPFTVEQRSAGLLAQRPESRIEERQFYGTALRALLRLFQDLPPEWRSSPDALARASLNCGVFGGSDISFIHEYAASQIKILRNPPHIAALEAIPPVGALKPWHLVVTVEQVGLALALRHSRVGVALLTPEADDECAQFLHLVGIRKQDQKLLVRVRGTLEKDFPSTAGRIAAAGELLRRE